MRNRGLLVIFVLNFFCGSAYASVKNCGPLFARVDAEVLEFTRNGGLKGVFESLLLPNKSDRQILIATDHPACESQMLSQTNERLGGALEIAKALQKIYPDKTTRFILYPRTPQNNAPLPEMATLVENFIYPENLFAPAGPKVRMLDELARAHLFMFMADSSATSPLATFQKEGATRGRGFSTRGIYPELIPSLHIDLNEVQRRLKIIHEILKASEMVGIEFEVRDPSTLGTGTMILNLDLRNRIPRYEHILRPEDPPEVLNLPVGEAWIAPYEGEVAEFPSRSEGLLPIEINGEIIVFRIKNNTAVEILTNGPESEKQRELLEQEPARGNIAELGIGISALMGVKPISTLSSAATMHNEKLGPHLAFGISGHLGGVTTKDSFRIPEQAVHQDYVYIPEMQPHIVISKMIFLNGAGDRLALIDKGSYVSQIFLDH